MRKHTKTLIATTAGAAIVAFGLGISQANATTVQAAPVKAATSSTTLVATKKHGEYFSIGSTNPRSPYKWGYAHGYVKFNNRSVSIHNGQLVNHKRGNATQLEVTVYGPAKNCQPNMLAHWRVSTRSSRPIMKTLPANIRGGAKAVWIDVMSASNEVVHDTIIVRR